MRTDVDRLSTGEPRESREAWWSEDFDRFLLSAIGDIGPGRVLDVGCGLGVLEQRLAPRLGDSTRFVGIDVDLARLSASAGGAAALAPACAISYTAGDALALPFRDASFAAAVAILVMQHITEPLGVLTEMRRVVGVGGLIVSVEADNPGQRLYLPHASPSLDAAVAAFWRRVDGRREPATRTVGPRLPGIFHQAGLGMPSARGFLVAHTSWREPATFATTAREGFSRVASAHGVEESSECRTLLEALSAEARHAELPFYTIATVPMFLVAARVGD